MIKTSYNSPFDGGLKTSYPCIKSITPVTIWRFLKGTFVVC